MQLALNDDYVLIKCAQEIENRLTQFPESNTNITPAETEETEVVGEVLESLEFNGAAVDVGEPDSGAGSNILLSTENIETELSVKRRNNLEQKEDTTDDPEWKAGSDTGSWSTEKEDRIVTSPDNANFAVKDLNRRTRKKRRHVSRELWECNVQKIKRCKGLEYKGLQKENGKKWTFSKVKKARQLKPACFCEQSKKKTKLQCSRLTDIQREAIFAHFWKKSWSEKKECVRNLVDLEPVKQRKTESSSSRRNSSFYCHLKNTEGLRIRVCKKQFLNTLGIGEWTMLNWIKSGNINKENENIATDEDENIEAQNATGNKGQKENHKVKTNDNTRKTRGANHRKEAEEKFLKSFLQDLPAMESHYCRATSSKRYLEPLWTSKQQLYLFYKKECQEQGIAALSSASFSNAFSDINYSLFKPKKDQCDVCLGFKTGNVDEHFYKEHLKKKDAARDEKSKDKDNEKWVFTMDLQSVLMAPLTKASAMYYKSKLVVHNFTIFNLKNKDGHCYLWHECQGGLNANEFASILYSFIMNLNTEKGDRVILYSDGCCYQNRNSTISNMLVLCGMQKAITIIQKYLEKGHTQMECDSMHSVIERKCRNTEIYTPAGYVSVCKSARLKPRPYNVTYLTFDFFKTFSNLSYYNSIRPGFKKGDPVVTDIRSLKYNPTGSIEYKINYDEDWQLLPRRKSNNVNLSHNLPCLYKEALKIDKKKFENLQSLKAVLEKEFHSFYDNLQYKE